MWNDCRNHCTAFCGTNHRNHFNAGTSEYDRWDDRIKFFIFGVYHLIAALLSVLVDAVAIFEHAKDRTLCVNRTGLVPEHGRPIASCTTLSNVRPPFNKCSMMDGAATVRVAL